MRRLFGITWPVLSFALLPVLWASYMGMFAWLLSVSHVLNPDLVTMTLLGLPPVIDGVVFSIIAVVVGQVVLRFSDWGDEFAEDCRAA